MANNLGRFTAVVDIGSNSVKFICFENQREVPRLERQLKIISQGSTVTRLGKETSSTGVFDPHSLKLTAETLENIKKSLDSDTEFFAVATESARKVRDPQDLVKIVKKNLNVDLKILSGNEEAELSSLGACEAARIQWSQDSGDEVIYPFIEVGGGSSQVGFHWKNTLKAESFPYGAVNTFEKIKFPTRAIAFEDLSSYSDQVSKIFSSAEYFEKLNNFSNEIKSLVESHQLTVRGLGIGGTLVSAVRAFSKNPLPEISEYRGSSFSLADLQENANNISMMDLSARLNIPHIEPGRADVLPVGLMLFIYLARTLTNESEFFFTAWGLRHGLAFKLLFQTS